MELVATLASSNAGRKRNLGGERHLSPSDAAPAPSMPGRERNVTGARRRALGSSCCSRRVGRRPELRRARTPCLCVYHAAQPPPTTPTRPTRGEGREGREGGRGPRGEQGTGVGGGHRALTTAAPCALGCHGSRLLGSQSGGGPRRPRAGRCARSGQGGRAVHGGPEGGATMAVTGLEAADNGGATSTRQLVRPKRPRPCLGGTRFVIGAASQARFRGW